MMGGRFFIVLFLGLEIHLTMLSSLCTRYRRLQGILEKTIAMQVQLASYVTRLVQVQVMQTGRQQLDKSETNMLQTIHAISLCGIESTCVHSDVWHVCARVCDAPTITITITITTMITMMTTMIMIITIIAIIITTTMIITIIIMTMTTIAIIHHEYK